MPSSPPAVPGATPPTPDASAEDAWRRHLLEEPAHLRALLARSHRIAVLGAKPEPEKPANYVPAYVKRAGYEIIPVPVYYPDATEMLGERVYRTLVAIPGPIDIVNVFRRPADVAKHVDDIVAKRPSAVWMQLGIRNDAVAEVLAREGIDVVQDHCILVELRKMGR